MDHLHMDINYKLLTETSNIWIISKNKPDIDLFEYKITSYSLRHQTHGS